MSALDNVRAAIEAATGHPARNGSARCPAHPDSNPSLSINEGRSGNVVLHCHAGCDTGAILAAIGLTEADLFEPNTWETTQKRRIVDTYDYHNWNGDLLYQVVRYEPKDFRQRRPDGQGGWIWNMAGVDRVLYRWPEVVSAVGRGETIYVTEGEKDADAMRRELNAMATTNPGGAGKWSSAYADALEGADVVVIADADTAGIEHAKTVAATLAEGTPIFLPAEGHKDIAQHLGAGLGLEDLRPLTDDLDPETEERQQSAEIFTAGLVSGAQILELPKPEPMVGTWLDRGMLAQLVGAYGSGKTFVALEVALSVATGRNWFGQQIHHSGQVLYVAAEGGYTMPDRVGGWAADTGRDIPDNLLLYPYRFDITDSGIVGDAGLWRPLRAAIEIGAVDPALVVLDTRSRLTVGDENASETAAKLIAACDQIRDLVPKVTILVIHHPGHGVTGRGRGHSSFEDNLDVVWSIEGRLRDGPVQLIDQKQKARAQNEDGLWLKLEDIGDRRFPRMVVTSEPGAEEDNLRSKILATVVGAPGRCTVQDLYSTDSIWYCGGQNKVRSTVKSMVNLGELVVRDHKHPDTDRTKPRLFPPLVVDDGDS